MAHLELTVALAILYEVRPAFSSKLHLLPPLIWYPMLFCKERPPKFLHHPSNHFALNHLRGLPRNAPTSTNALATTFLNAILATTLFQCWPILFFYTGWATMVTLVNERVTDLTFAPTFLTVIGTVLGFVISYRTTSSFERYNEGRRYWSQIVLASRTLARAVWFHVPELKPAGPTTEGQTDEQQITRGLIEKKTVINLVEAFSVSVKHYLRGEQGIGFADLFDLVKFLPSYNLPVGVIPKDREVAENIARVQAYQTVAEKPDTQCTVIRCADGDGGTVVRPSFGNESSIAFPVNDTNHAHYMPLPATSRPRHTRCRSVNEGQKPRRVPTFMSTDDRDVDILPASLPPKNSTFDMFPFSLLMQAVAGKWKQFEGKKVSKMRAKQGVVTGNVPLEILLYLTSYIATLGARTAIDSPTTTLLINSINQMTDALTGLERILTTPIPFSYSFHLWAVTIIYNLALPFQIYSALHWLTIPASVIVSFVFFGFLVAGEEIENPFGYDMNDLNMDHFTHNIIRSELRALTASQPPKPEDWAFSPRNNYLFTDPKTPAKNENGFGVDSPESDVEEGVTPEEWIRRGRTAIEEALRNAR